MSEATPVLLLPAALVDPAWIGADRIAELAASPCWTALARRTTVRTQAGSDGPPPHDPGHERWLHARLALPEGTSLAAAAAIADGVAGAAWRIDPVHLHVGRDHLVLTDPASLSPTREDAVALAAAIAPLLADEGLALEVGTPRRWYLRETDPARPLALRTRPLSGATGRNIDAWLPQGDDARRWRRIVNEIQMTWHALNEVLQATHEPAVNSVWIEGRCPVAAPGVELAAAVRVAAHGPGAGPLETALSDGTRLRIDDRLHEAQLAGDPAGWLAAWRRLEADTLAGIVRADGAWRDGARIVLAGDAGWREIEVAPRAGWRFWRRTDGVGLLAEPSATR
ncbi:MAG: hypothetical protein ACK5XG_21750 [Burkholderiales bacterium]